MLKALEIKKELDAKRSALTELEKKDADFETRTSDVLTKLEAMTAESSKEERDALELDQQNLEAEKVEHDAEKQTVSDEIAELEKELEEEEAKSPKEPTPDDLDKAETRKAKTMEVMEVRDSKAYIDAYAEYVKTGRVEEVRSLLTENATSGTVAVPTMVYDIVKTAWEKEGIMNLVKKSYLKGNLKVGFEISSTGAVIHEEGDDPVDEETLVLGIVNLVPMSIKKWVAITDEIMDLRGEAFLQYVYDELAYQIAKKAADTLVDIIVDAPDTATSSAVPVRVLEADTVTLGTIASAISLLSDEAENPVIVMNKATWAKFKSVQYAGNYAVDPFEGLNVVFNNTLPTFDAAEDGDTYAIVGDFGMGALANFPNGEGIEFKFDTQTLMTSDLVRVLGREYVALGLVAPYAFVKINKSEQGE